MCPQVTFGIDPIDVLMSLMGLIPKMHWKLISNNLGEWSHKKEKMNHGIDPIGILKPPMGLVPYLSTNYLWD